MDSVVYFIQSVIGGPIKIGHTVDMPKRLASIQTGCPFELRVLCTMPGERRDELDMHFRFDVLHVGLEWFRPENPLVSFIESNHGTVFPWRAWDPQKDKLRNHQNLGATRRYARSDLAGDRVRGLRVELGLSEERFSEISGLHPDTIRRIESGNVRVTESRTLPRVAAGLGLSAFDLERYIVKALTLEQVLPLCAPPIPNPPKPRTPPPRGRGALMFAGSPPHPPVAPTEADPLAVTVALAERVVALRVALHAIASPLVLSLPGAQMLALRAIAADDERVGHQSAPADGQEFVDRSDAEPVTAKEHL